MNRSSDNLTVRRLGKDDSELARHIRKTLMEAEGDVPSPGRLLEDARSYLLAAFLGNEAVGYAFAFRFPSPYSPHDMAYLYDVEVAAPHRFMTSLIHSTRRRHLRELHET